MNLCDRQYVSPHGEDEIVTSWIMWLKICVNPILKCLGVIKFNLNIECSKHKILFLS